MREKMLQYGSGHPAKKITVKSVYEHLTKADNGSEFKRVESKSA
jgi:hypothetical protein